MQLLIFSYVIAPENLSTSDKNIFVYKNDNIYNLLYLDENNDIKHQLRYDPHQDFYKRQSLSISNKNIFVRRLNL